MKYIFTLIAFLFATSSFATGGSKSIPLSCSVGGTKIKILLDRCGDQIDTYGYGPYWCEGDLNESFSVKFTGYSGTGDGEIRITLRFEKFSGISPIEINGLSIGCELSK